MHGDQRKSFRLVVGGERSAQRGTVDNAVAVDADDGHALGRELPAAEHAGMIGRADIDPGNGKRRAAHAIARRQKRRRSLRRAGGEYDMLGLCADETGDAGTRILDQAAGGPALGMYGGSIRIDIERRKHRLTRLIRDRRAGVPVEIGAVLRHRSLNIAQRCRHCSANGVISLKSQSKASYLPALSMRRFCLVGPPIFEWF